MRLRGQDLTNRLAALSKTSSAFNEMAKQQSEKDRIKLTLSAEEESTLVKAVEKVSSLKQHARLTMAAVRVPDLKKRQEIKINLLKKKKEGEEESRRSLLKKLNLKEKVLDLNRLDNFEGVENDIRRSNMNVSWMVSEAREEVNAAIEKLMYKNDDSGRLKIKKMEKVIEEEWNDGNPPEQSNVS